MAALVIPKFLAPNPTTAPLLTAAPLFPDGAGGGGCCCCCYSTSNL